MRSRTPTSYLAQILPFVAIVVLVVTSPASAQQQQEGMTAISTRLHQMEAPLDKILLTLQQMEDKSKREEYFAGCVPEATQGSEGGLCGANETRRWVSEESPLCQ